MNGELTIGEVTRNDTTARVHATIPPDLKYLDGHFPGNPIVPGVAQLVLVERSVRAAWGDLGPPRGLRRLKFTARIDPGDAVVLDLTRTPDGVRFAISRGDTECSRGTIVYG